MVSQSQANYSLNIGLHVLILFTFLTIFFFAFASKLAQDSIQSALGDIIDKETDTFLTQLDSWNKKLDKFDINWEEINTLAKKVEAKSQGELPEIAKNNKKLRWIGVAMIASLLALLIGMYLYYKLVKGYDVHLGRIFMENIVIFTFIGIVEFVFFTKIAAKYVPVTPDFVATSLLERIKYQVTRSILEKKNT